VSTAPPSRIIRFGVFEINLATGELRQRGQKVKLQEQPFQILVALLERPGELVTREELHSKLWPADTFVDFDHGLNAAVKRLRDALGESAERPMFVETVARRGYRFIGNVEQSGATSPDLSRQSGPTLDAEKGLIPVQGLLETVSRPWSRNWRFALAGLVIVGVAGLTAAWLLLRKELRSNVSNASPTLQRLTTNPSQNGIIASAISPDGKYLAYSDKTGVYLRLLSTGELHALLPNVSNVTSLAWFPDGSQLLASWATPPENKQLWALSIVGGAPRQLSNEGWAASVSPDGSQILFLKRADFAEMGHEIWVMRTNGADPRKLLSFPEEQVATPAWSPDGKWIAYVKNRFGPYAQETWIEAFNLEQGTSKTLLTGQSVEGWGMTWLPDGRLIYAIDEPLSIPNSSNFWTARIDLSSGQFVEQPVRITSGDGFVVKPSTTADGKRLVFNRTRPQADIYVAEFSAQRLQLGTPQQLTFDDADDLPFDWTLDNKAVLFISSRTGTEGIFRQRISETSAEMLVSDGERKKICRLSPDGTQVLYLVSTNPADNFARVRLMRASVNGGPPQMVLEAPGLDNYQCSRSPAAVCVFSQQNKGELAFSIFDLRSGKSREFTNLQHPALGWNWSLSPDGAIIAATVFGADENRIRLLPVSGGPVRDLRVKGHTGFNSVDWAADSKGLFVSSNPTGWRQSLLYVNLSGNARQIRQVDSIWPNWAVSSRDGKYVAMPTANLVSNVWMVANF
jgi:Tol biopolymer transport system component/DNA-binding winged helix-turn-helix (wHTH) protein